MIIPPWIYDDWFIALASIIVALAVEPLILALIRRIRSLFGDFSGTYLAITGQPFSDARVIEVAKCRHVGSRVQGRILGVSFVELRDEGLVEIAPNNSKYKLSGIVDERLLVLSYHTNVRGAKGSGTLTLHADGSGRVFTGVWAGLDRGKVLNSPCIWVRVDNKLASPSKRKVVLQEARKVLSTEQSPWRKSRIIFLAGQGGIGKTAIAREISEAAKEKFNFT
jgi:hypothetical protein